MKTSKFRFISLLAVATLLVTCFCSTLSVSADNTASHPDSMIPASLTFVNTDRLGQPAETSLTQPLHNYNDYNSAAKGSVTYTAEDGQSVTLESENPTSGYWILFDRFYGMATDTAKLSPTTDNNYLVVDWDREDRRFEVVAKYAKGARRLFAIPRYGFVLMQYNTFTSNATSFFNNIALGTEVQVNLDKMVQTIDDRATAISYGYKTYEQMILRSTPAQMEQVMNGTRKPIEVTDITISTVDTYVDNTTGAAANMTGAALSFHPDAYNNTIYNDYIGLYDANVADSVSLPTSTRGFYIPLKPVDGQKDVYEVVTYPVPSASGSPAITPLTKADIPEGGYMLCMTHAISSSIYYMNSSSTTNKLYNIQYSNIKKYFAVGKQFKIEITPTVTTIDAGQVRFAEPTGLRFKTQITGWQKMVNAGYELEAGTLIMPKDLLGDTAFTIDVLGAENAGTTYLDIKQTKWVVNPTASNSATGEMNAAIVNIKEGNYGRQFAARGYVKATKNGVTEYFYSDAITYRSVREIADAALADEECDTKYSEDLQTILRGFATPAAA